MTPTTEQLRQAISIREQIDSLEARLDSIFNPPAGAEMTKAPGRTWKMSAAARAKISKAARKRWALKKAANS